MRAVTIPRFGDADVLTLTDMPTPMPGPGEVAIDVAFAGANYAEILYRRGVSTSRCRSFQGSRLPATSAAHPERAGQALRGALDAVLAGRIEIDVRDQLPLTDAPKPTVASSPAAVPASSSWP